MASVSDRIRRGKEGGQKFSGLGTPQGYSSRKETTASTANAETSAPVVAAAKPTETPIAKTKREGTFGEAFASARKSGAGEFEYKGKKYHTRTKEEANTAQIAKSASGTRAEPAKEPVRKMQMTPHSGVPLRAAGNTRPVPKIEPKVTVRGEKKASKDKPAQPGTGVPLRSAGNPTGVPMRSAMNPAKKPKKGK